MKVSKFTTTIIICIPIELIYYMISGKKLSCVYIVTLKCTYTVLKISIYNNNIDNGYRVLLF